MCSAVLGLVRTQRRPASSCSSTVNSASLSLGRETGPADRSPSVPALHQARRQRCTERTPTRKSLATSALEAPAANRSAASSRIRSRNACRSGVSPPPCGYLTQPAYRDDHTSSAPNDITPQRSVVRIVNVWACYPRTCQVIQCVQFKLASDVGDI